MSWSSRFAAVLAILTLTWAACSGQPTQPGECTSDSDCPLDVPFCISNACTQPGGGSCISDSDCGKGETCDVSGGFCFCVADDAGVCPGLGGAGGAGGQGGSGGGGSGGAGGHGGGAGTGGAGGGTGTGGIAVDGG